MTAIPASTPGAARRAGGFTLIELVIVTVVVAVLAAIAMPSYRSFVVKSARQAAQAELMDLGALQEKIYNTSGAYSSSLTADYTGASTGGLGIANGKTRDSKYTVSLAVNGASFTLTATPIDGTTQAGDGTITLASNGVRKWGTKDW